MSTFATGLPGRWMTTLAAVLFATVTAVPALGAPPAGSPPNVRVRPGASTRPGQAQPAQSQPQSRPAPARATGKDAEPVYVIMTTSKGEIVLELNRELAPLTAANFLKYVDSGFYDGTIFHRVMPKAMILGGGYTADLKPKPATLPPVQSESLNGLNNKRGTIAMGRPDNNPDSATTQFFINVIDNPIFDEPRGGTGYAVFGKVVAGMKIVDDIRFMDTASKSGMTDVPVETVTIQSIKRTTADVAKAKAEAEKPKRRAPEEPLPPSPKPTPPPVAQAPQPVPAPTPQPAPAPQAERGPPVYVLFSTSKGDFVLELDREHAPITVANFLGYVDSHFYDNTIFHRIVRMDRAGIDVIQGGGFTADAREKPTGAPIKNEWQNGLKNARGTISMARRAPPDSATSQFFINTTDNPVLDGPNGQAGYAVFGRIVAGLGVADAIRNSATHNTPMPDWPVETITLTSAKRITDDEAKKKIDAEKAGGGAAKPPLIDD